MRHAVYMSAARIATLTARLSLIETAITNAITNGHVKAYTTEIQGVTYRGLDELEAAERRIRNELARLNRGSRFGGIGFKRITSSTS